MFYSFQDLRLFALEAEGERKGQVEDLYVDDAEWEVRYLVASTGFWLMGRQSLISPGLLGTPDAEALSVAVRLGADEVSEQPDPDEDPPVSRQPSPAPVPGAFAWPPFLPGPADVPLTPMIADQQVRLQQLQEPEEGRGERGDPHLRSMREMVGYDLDGTDGSVGMVADFLIDPDNWRVRYLVVDTGGWLPGRQVVVACDWISWISWPECRIMVDVTRNQVETSPELSDIKGIARSEELAIQRHYGALGAMPV